MFGLSGISASRVEEASPSLRFIYLLEIFTAWALIEATIWHYGKTQFRLFWISFAFIVASTIAHRPKLSEIGLSVRGLRTSLWVIPSAIAVSSAAMLLAWAAGTLHPLFGAVAQAKHSSGYAIWAVLQQFILQSYFYLRFEKLVSPRSAILLSAGLFCFAHIPNPVLRDISSQSQHLRTRRSPRDPGTHHCHHSAGRHSAAYARGNWLLPLS